MLKRSDKIKTSAVITKNLFVLDPEVLIISSHLTSTVYIVIVCFKEMLLNYH